MSRTILCNDGAGLALPDEEAPVSVDALVRAVIDPLRGTAINTLYWQLGADLFHGTPTHRLSDWYAHRTATGAVWGQDRETFATAGEWRLANTVAHFFAQGQDPVEAVVRHGQAAGLDVFVSLRINDGSDCRLARGRDDPNLSPVRAEHPEWLLDNQGFRHDMVTEKQRDHSRFAYNFEIDAVRDYTLSLIQESITQYDLDGIDLDFCRQPALFKADQARDGAPLITAMLRQVRAMLDAKSASLCSADGMKARRDRRAARNDGRLLLSVRVPPDLSCNRAAGLDVESWMREKLVDIVIVGDPRGWNYRLPIEAFSALARAQGSRCQIIAQNLCGFREAAPRSAKVLYGAKSYYTAAEYRAVAAVHWRAGADGQFLWNQHLVRYMEDAPVPPPSWREIGDAAALARTDKLYLAGRRGLHDILPVTFSGADLHASVTIELADTFDDHALAPRATLRVLITQLTALDELEFTLNDVAIPLSAFHRRLNYNDCWLEADVSAFLHAGVNSLGVKVIARNRGVLAPLTLDCVDVLVEYVR